MKLVILLASALLLTGCSTFSKNVAKQDQLILEVPAELMKKPEPLKQVQ